MFERLNEQARRAIFFARYEASQFGSMTIDLDHLVLGALKPLNAVPTTVREAVRKRIQERTPTGHEKISTSVDMPLSPDAKRALAYASEEAGLRRDNTITVRELLLGVLRISDSPAARILEEIKIASYLDSPILPGEPKETAPPEAPAPEDVEPRTVYASSTLGPLIERLERMVSASESYLQDISEVSGDHVLKRKPWTRREALGHLIDWASTYHQWCARILVEPRLNAHSYPLEDWVSPQRYQQVHWRRLVTLWLGLNRLLIHVASHVPERKANIPCKVGIDPVQPFHALLARYLNRHEDLLGQILARD